MPTTNMTAITDAVGFSKYILSPKKDEDGKDLDIADRILCKGGTMVAEPELDNIQDLRNEFSIHAGRKYDGNAVRISLDEEEHLSPAKWECFVSDVMAEYLPNRPYIYAVHHDGTNHVEHCHVVATYLDADGNYLNFAGNRKAKNEAIRQQKIIDRISRKYGLSTLERPAGTYRRNEVNDADTRQTIAIRNRLQDADIPDAYKNLWLDELRQNFKDAVRNEKTGDAVLGRLEEKGWLVHRETERHITLSKDIGGKIYKVRLGRLNKTTPNRQALQNYLNRLNTKPSEKPILTPTAPPITPYTASGASNMPTYTAGNAYADENATEDEKQAIAIYNKEMAKLQVMAGQVEEVENEVDSILEKPLHDIMNKDAIIRIKNKR